MLNTVFEFELPKGFVDPDGNLHRDGVMRLATAADEILPLKDHRVQNLPAYLIIVLLARVVIKLGTLSQVNPSVVEGLFAEDLAYLQGFYNQINGIEARSSTVECPKCSHRFETESPLLGGS